MERFYELMETIFTKDFITSFLQEIIISIVVAITTWTVPKVVNWYKNTRPSKKLWRLKNNDQVIIVSPEPSGYVNKEFSDTVFPSDYIAIAELQNYLSKLYKNLKVQEYYANEIPTEKMKENLILIGNKETNSKIEKITNKILTKKLPVRFEEGKIIDTKGEISTFKSLMSFNQEARRHEVTLDYASISILKNPLNANKKLFVLSGNYTFGNLAAVRFMLYPLVKTISKYINSNGQYSLIIKADIFQRHISNIGIVSFYFFDESKNEWVKVRMGSKIRLIIGDGINWVQKYFSRVKTD